jgi:hypothetical protein
MTKKSLTPDDLDKTTRLIYDRAQELFARHRNTRYWITVVNDKYQQQYNFFFNIVPRGQRHKSIPLHTLERYDLNYLEHVTATLRAVLPLTYEFVGFTGQVWPHSQRVIQWRREADE